MTRGEYLRSRIEALNKKMIALAIKTLESAYDEHGKYAYQCGKYAGLKGERDSAVAELQKDPDAGEEQGASSLATMEDEDDTAVTVRRVTKPVGNLRRNGSRPASWGG